MNLKFYGFLMIIVKSGIQIGQTQKGFIGTIQQGQSLKSQKALIGLKIF